MGKDKLRRFEENKNFHNLYQPSFDDVFRRDYELKGRWGEHVFGNNHPIVLELGCGKGEYTLALAALHEDINFLGMDIKGARLWRGARTALEEHRSNVAFVRGRIEFIESFFGPGEVSEIWITFPDPQPKRENKRLTSPPFLNKYKTFLRPEAVIHLKTDSRELFDYTKEVVQQRDDMRILEAIPDIYHSGEMPVREILFCQNLIRKPFSGTGESYNVSEICSRKSLHTDGGSRLINSSALSECCLQIR
jgi:tRNA (guanine-N7-)-methyltransferase